MDEIKNLEFGINPIRLKYLLEMYNISKEKLLLELQETNKKVLLSMDELNEILEKKRKVKLTILKKLDNIFEKGINRFISKSDLPSKEKLSIFFRKDKFNSPIVRGSIKLVEEFERKKDEIETYCQNINYDLLIFDYGIKQIDYCIFSREMKKSCDTDYLTILYFFNGEFGNDCREQALTLDSFKIHFADKRLIFAIDGNYKNVDTINMIKKIFSINSCPTLIVEDKKYVGYSDHVKLLDVVCSLYDPVPEECNI